MKKIMAIMMAMLLLLGCVSCAPANTDGGGTTASSGTTADPNEITDPDGGGTTGDEQEPVDPEIKILLSELSSYQIVYPDVSASGVKDAADELKQALNALDCAPGLDVKSDYFKEGFDLLAKSDFEILIGSTNREESEFLKADLRSNDYGYAVVNRKIVIYGHNETTIKLAVRLFVEERVENADFADGVFLSSTDQKIVSRGYRFDAATFAGHALSDCVIVYPDAAPNDEDLLANKLSETILRTTTFYVPVMSDANATQEGTYEILLGETNRALALPNGIGDNEAYLAALQSGALISGGNSIGIYYAIQTLSELFENATVESRKMAISIEDPIQISADSDTLRVMSFNLQVSNLTNERADRVITMIKSYTPEVFGVQEATPAWLSRLSQAFPEYAYVGLGRDGQNLGEHSAIFYRKDLFTLLSTETKWLSDTPDVVGSKFDESDYIRIVTWAVLQRKSDGFTFTHANTHLDWGCLQKQVDTMLSLVPTDYPIILTGDFNMNPHEAAFQTLLDNGFINSAREAENLIWQSTVLTGDGYAPTIGDSRQEIDFCMVKADAVAVSEYRVCDETIRGVPASDHYALYIEMTID